MQKQDPYTCCLQETHFTSQDTHPHTHTPTHTHTHTHTHTTEGMGTGVHANGNRKKTGTAILISDKIVFETKTLTRDQERHYVLMKGSIQQENSKFKYISIPHRST